MIDKQQLRSGYALLDVVLAVALFGITVTGLIGVLQSIGETSGAFARDQMIMRQLQTSLAEKQRLSPSQMTAEWRDETLAVTFRTVAEPYQIDNGEGAELEDLYRLTATATYEDEGGEQTISAILLIHAPES
jgi:Tfp pilus assembly protein PilV